MSLLMKALEKAAKDRVDARAEPAVTAAPAAASTAASPGTPAPGRSELTLEPLPAGMAAPRPTAPAPGLTPAPSRMPAAPPAAAAAPAGVQAQSQAAVVLQAAAGSRAPNRVVDYARAHPVVVLGSLAGLFAAAFAMYVYLQIAHPGIFTGRPPLAPPGKGPEQPLVQAPVAPVPVPAPVAPLPAAPLLKEAATASAAAAARKPAPAAQAAAEEAAPRNTVVVSRGSVEPVLSPRLFQAYTALRARQFDLARLYYGEIIAAEPMNIDALLGLAAIAAQIGDSEEATRRYMQILELEPRHALAQNGLIGLLGRADPPAAVSKLRHLISLEPAPYLYFTLGNLHADQSQWAAAQQAYFQAHHLEPSNPDYAYNLAVALEHLSQPKLALGFYRRAVQMATAGGRANFNVTQAQERIGKLAAQVE